MAAIHHSSLHSYDSSKVSTGGRGGGERTVQRTVQRTVPHTNLLIDGPEVPHANAVANPGCDRPGHTESASCPSNGRRSTESGTHSSLDRGMVPHETAEACAAGSRTTVHRPSDKWAYGAAHGAAHQPADRRAGSAVHWLAVGHTESGPCSSIDRRIWCGTLARSSDEDVPDTVWRGEAPDQRNAGRREVTPGGRRSCGEKELAWFAGSTRGYWNDKSSMSNFMSPRR